jgi:hypothetical protein
MSWGPVPYGRSELDPAYGFRSCSGNLAMPAAIFLASSLVMRLAAARRPGFGLEVDIRHGKIVGVADDIRDSPIFLDCPRCGGAAGRR